ALELAEALRLNEVLTQALTTKGTLLIRRNRLEEARILLEGSLALAVEHDIPAAAIRAGNNLAVVYESLDRYADAVALSDRAAAIARRVGDRVWEQRLVAGPISAVTLLGRWDEALAREAEVISMQVAADESVVFLVAVDCWRGDVEHARSRLEESGQLKNHEGLDYATSYLLHEAQVLRAEGSTRAAQEALDPVLNARSELGISFLNVKLGFVEALECAIELGDAARVEQLLETIERLRPGERPPLLEAHAARCRAKLAGDAPAAQQGFRRAASIFRERELAFWLAVTELEHAEWLTGRGRSDDAQPLLANARETFKRLEAKPWL